MSPQNALDTMRRLSAAVLAVSRHLATDEVLQTIVATARELIGAEYAALGIPDGAGSFAQFLVDGISDEQWAAIDRLGHAVEDTLRGSGQAEFGSHEIGMAILEPLRELDEVAYLRFASVYRSFSSIEDFEKEIAELRTPGSGQAAD